MTKSINAIGKKYGNLTVIKFSGKNKHGQPKVDCLCNCGKKFNTVLYYITFGGTKSCGCLKIKVLKDRCFKHGLSHSKFHNTYSAMRTRVNNKKQKRYSYYGGRGIKFLWKNFQSFYDDMYISYLEHIKLYGEHETTIERININGNYSKENCRWATYQEQSYNRTDSRIFTINGETKCTAQWAKQFNINYHTLCTRLRIGWSIEEALGIIYKEKQTHKSKS